MDMLGSFALVLPPTTHTSPGILDRQQFDNYKRYRLHSCSGKSTRCSNISGQRYIRTYSYTIGCRDFVLSCFMYYLLWTSGRPMYSGHDVNVIFNLIKILLLTPISGPLKWPPTCKELMAWWIYPTNETWYTDKLPFTSYTTLTPHSFARRGFDT